MARRLNGVNPLAYMGVRAVTPAQMVVNKDRRPTTTDLQNFALGTWWIIPTRSSTPTNEVWILINKTATTATWIEVDSGGGQVVPGNQYTLLTADGSGAYGPNVGPGTAGQLLVSQGATGNPAFVTPTAGTGLTLTANAGTIEYALDGPVTVDQGGTSKTSFDPYTVVCGGTGATTPLQQVSGTGSSGDVLTSQGAGALPQWAAVGGGGGFSSINVQVFTSDATYTPTANMKYVIVEMVGGGGGGGGFEDTSTVDAKAGAGGGSGGYARKFIDAATIGASQTLTIGSAGVGAINAFGTSGGNSTFGAILACNGGGGGNRGGGSVLIANGGSGGSASGGDINIEGQAGGSANMRHFVASSVSIRFSFPGSGGDTPLGLGGTAKTATFTAIITGRNGTGYGSGGAGASTIANTGAGAGGDGTPGVCIITEFIE